MGNKSLLELLQQEKKLCDRLQSVENMLDGLRGDAQDAKQAAANLERHDALVHRLTEELMEIRDSLYPVRVEIGGKIGEYTYLFEQHALNKLRNPGEVAENA